jgi:hypothetical protein
MPPARRALLAIPYVISAARTEAERMRSAVASADGTAKVNMEARQFSRLADLIAAVCDLASDALSGAPATVPIEEEPVKTNQPAQNARSLAQIESDMIAAEQAYSAADERLNQAQRDRDAALAAIDKHQFELDAAVDRLRERSPAGSIWRGSGAGAAGVLMLEHEDSSAEEAALLRAATATPGTPDPAEPADLGNDEPDTLKAAWQKHRGDKVDWSGTPN